ncbi:MAG TPA: CGNR zinc finger domain-containing protein [Nocardioides sp.]|uniref:CGNR zinc finger domain-containing protein n=1 Tax=uncultured Nocardioides sp. TaxID=198441 RepID=UPI002615AE3D|nr:CGNR zinc finger domain-containing protein [uncultured Nocardioides sp.]HRI95413.1 CGNR zinc finger domain-containing protein [Nocardioides sp.]
MSMDDLELAVLLLNSVDLLEDPADRMAHDLRWWRRALRRNGHAALARTQREADRRGLLELRAIIRSVFETSSEARARTLLNDGLASAGAVVQVTPAGLGVGGGLAARLLYAVAQLVAEGGVARLGICASDPCRCAYVDRTRGGTRRYCCTLCNDRAAARAYRQRKGQS